MCVAKCLKIKLSSDVLNFRSLKSVGSYLRMNSKNEFPQEMLKILKKAFLVKS